VLLVGVVKSEQLKQRCWQPHVGMGSYSGWMLVMGPGVRWLNKYLSRQ